MKIKTAFFLLLLHCTLIQANAQWNTGFYGTWSGRIPLGSGLSLVFHIADNGQGGFITTADSPDQSAFGLKCDTTWVADSMINIHIRAVNASYKGRLVNDSTLEGAFVQGAEIPLTLTKTAGPKRPQTPRALFPYKSEDIVYQDPQGERQYGATITIPQGSGPFPAVVLITGSGAQNRDEELLGHKPFAVIADALTRNGFVVLRVDDRGVGKTSGPFRGSTSADFAKDVNISLDYLLKRPEVDKKKLGLLGHSEGGMIAPMVAAKRNDIDFIVLLAGPGVKITQLMAEQNAAIARLSGLGEPAIQAYISMYSTLTKEILSTPDSASAVSKARETVGKWIAKTDTALLNQLQVDTTAGGEAIALAMAAQLSDKWFRYFMAFDPAPYLEALRCKVLALNGTKDVQVIASSNLAGINAALKKSRSKAYSVKEMPGLNHLFQECRECTPAEYPQLEETFSPAALKEINNWLNQNVK